MKIYKSIALELKDDPSGNYYQFEGYASTFGNVDLGGDIVVKGAYSESLNNQPYVPICWQHNMDEPIGISQNLYEDQKGLKIDYLLPKDDDFVKGRVMPQVRIGSVKEMSVGILVNDYKYADNGIRYLNKLQLFEVSLVTKAMNPQALIESFKSIDSLKGVEKYLKLNGISATQAKSLISMIHNFKESDIQRDAGDDKRQRDAEQFKSLLSEMTALKDLFTNQNLLTI